jgi:hypothetical protein
VSDLDSVKRMKVTTATTAIRMTFDFSVSKVGKAHIRVMEHVSYFAKGHARPLSLEIVPTPWDDEVAVFEDLFSTGLHMSPHPMLMEILQKFHIQLHQLMPNAIMKIGKFICVVNSCLGCQSAEVFTKYYKLHYQ